jgi:hypothetical protein
MQKLLCTILRVPVRMLIRMFLRMCHPCSTLVKMMFFRWTRMIFCVCCVNILAQRGKGQVKQGDGTFNQSWFWIFGFIFLLLLFFVITAFVFFTTFFLLLFI